MARPPTGGLGTLRVEIYDTHMTIESRLTDVFIDGLHAAGGKLVPRLLTTHIAS